jgi:hypothetical protein
VASDTKVEHSTLRILPARAVRRYQQARFWGRIAFAHLDSEFRKPLRILPVASQPRLPFSASTSESTPADDDYGSS